MVKKFYASLVLAVALIMGLSSCAKDGNTATLVVHLTDAPANYEEVLIDVQGIQIHSSLNEAEGAWTTLPVTAGVYNLLNFRNGLDVLLATAELPVGTISQMRLILGTNNRVKIGGVYYNLDTPSAQQSGLKFNIHAVLTEGITYDLWIDFDAARSIVAKGNGTYSLKPVIRTFNEAVTGAIKGIVLPVAASATVRAIANGDTLSTMAAADGKFMFKGIVAGTYKMLIEPKATYTGRTIDVVVATGLVTDMGTITLVAL